MASLNKVMVIGNLGADPEMRFAPSGSPVTSFNIASSRIYTTKEGEKKKETEWFSAFSLNVRDPRKKTLRIQGPRCHSHLSDFHLPI